MLIIGAMGAYLSRESQQVATTTRSEDTPAAVLTAPSDGRLLALESKLAQVTERYGQRLGTLETTLQQTVDPYETRLSRVESRLAAIGDPDAGGVLDSSGAQAPFDARANDARVSALEYRVEQGYAGQDARLQALEHRLTESQIPYEQRIRALEQQLTYASARLDYLSAEMETLVNNAALVEASATLQTDPPAALPVNGTDSPSRAPTTNATAQTPMGPPTDANITVAPETTAMTDDKSAAPLPHDLPPEDAVPFRASGTPPAPVSKAMQAGERQTASLERQDQPQEPGAAGTPLHPAPTHARTVQTPEKPTDAGAREFTSNAPRGTAGTGDWVINLASYASESIAARKLADFRRKGVSAEQTAAMVNGKTIYRVRIAGFDTRSAATAHAETVRDQLGLKETWITRR